MGPLHAPRPAVEAARVPLAPATRDAARQFEQRDDRQDLHRRRRPQREREQAREREAAEEALTAPLPLPGCAGERAGEGGERLSLTNVVRWRAHPAPLPCPLPRVRGRGRTQTCTRRMT